uniref:Uncharacterized protein n=1 Tax=Mycena chlorophos TaxID=658473 RepID=A0ABQ0KZE2_MYCCL|nr:predicted protein [Mycena chlorophos]
MTVESKKVASLAYGRCVPSLSWPSSNRSRETCCLRADMIDIEDVRRVVVVIVFLGRRRGFPEDGEIAVLVPISQLLRATPPSLPIPNTSFAILPSQPSSP